MLPTCARDLLTAKPNASCVRPNSSTRRLKPSASSIGLRSARCRFSTSAVAATSVSVMSRCTAGTSCSPARAAARQRRSPAMIWKRSDSVGWGRTRIGCSTPWARMELARLSSASGSIVVRGWYGLGSSRSSAMWRKSADCAPLAGAARSPSSAASPRPRRGEPGLALMGSPCRGPGWRAALSPALRWRGRDRPARRTI